MEFDLARGECLARACALLSGFAAGKIHHVHGRDRFQTPRPQ